MQPSTHTANWQQRNVKMSTTDIIGALRKRAKEDKVFEDVAHVFALRERARQQITIAALRLRMGENGFHHEKRQYASVLTFLASLGFGTLEKNRSNEVVSLKNIKITLQSIGLATVGNLDKLETFHPQYAYLDLPAKPQTMPQDIIVTPEAATAKVQNIPPKAVPLAETVRVTITAYVKDQPVNFPVASGITMEQLVEILADLYAKKGGN